MLSAGIAMAIPSVRLSVTRVLCIKTAKRFVEILLFPDSPIILVFWRQIFCWYSKRKRQVHLRFYCSPITRFMKTFKTNAWILYIYLFLENIIRILMWILFVRQRYPQITVMYVIAAYHFQLIVLLFIISFYSVTRVTKKGLHETTSRYFFKIRNLTCSSRA